MSPSVQGYLKCRCHYKLSNVTTLVSATICCLLLQFIWPHAMGSPAAVIAKVLLDQAFMAPLGIALFFQVMGMLEGNTAHQAFQSTKEKFWPTVKANYMLWPAANAINFAFVPPAQRILYCNVVYVSISAGVSANCALGN